jgi:thioredoxin 1
MIIKVDSNSFEEKVLNASMPVVVDVWAPWCKPCKKIEPVIERLSDKFDGQVLFAKLNADENQDEVKRHKIMGIPTLLFFSHGKLVKRKTGVQSEIAITQNIMPLLTMTPELAEKREVKGIFNRPSLKEMDLGCLLGLTAVAFLAIGMIIKWLGG